MSVQQLFFNNTDDSDVILNLYSGDCPARFQAYATVCSDLFGDSSNEVNDNFICDM